MRTKRNFWSKVFVGFWVILFIIGISQVFLFLQGYKPFSFDKEDVQQGYATFSSKHSLFLDGDYLGSGAVYDRHPLGAYTLCTQSLGYSSSCFDEVEILGNDFSSQKIEDISLFPDLFAEKAAVWTDEKVYFVKEEKGLFWYDSAKKQVFYIQEEKGYVQSFFPEFDVTAIVFDEKRETYVLQGADSEGLILEQPISFFSSSSDFFAQLAEEEYVFDGKRLLKSLDFWSLSQESSLDLISVFSENIDNFFVIAPEITVMVFPQSMYIFQSDMDRFRFIELKDKGSEVVFLEESGEVFFVQEGLLKSVKLL